MKITPYSTLHPSAGFRPSWRGFSLVELMVVISVIGVLAAIAIPALAGVFDNSTTTKNKRNAQNIATLHAGARGSGATFNSTTKEGIVAELLQGKPGMGSFTGTVFRIPLAQAEADKSLAYLTYDSSSKELRFDKDAEASGIPASSEPPPQTPSAPQPSTYDEWFQQMFYAFRVAVEDGRAASFESFEADYKASHPPPGI